MCAIFAINSISETQELYLGSRALTKRWLYSRLKSARRFSGSLALALDAGASDVPAIRRDHCSVDQNAEQLRLYGTIPTKSMALCKS